MRDILVVDDSKTSLKMIKQALENSYKVYAANSAELALEMLERKLIDLVLMDINMPDIDGFRAVEEMKRRERCSDVPVIFVTALSDPVTIERCKALGENYIVKPFDRNKMLKMIEEVLGEE